MEYVTRDHFDKKFDELGRMVAEGFLAVDKRFDRLEGRVGRLEIGFIGLRSDHQETQERIARLEAHHERTFRRIDEFLTLVHRHESEIAALRGGQRRIEERLGKG